MEDHALATDATAPVNPEVLRRPWATAGLVALAVLVLVFGTSATQGTDPNAFDVVVAGAGPGGIGAAIQAASMGSKVALVEETGWLGGQISAAGVSTMDEGSVAPRSYGVYREFVNRSIEYYDARKKSVHTCYGSAGSICVEASVAQKILTSMVGRYASITVLLDTRIVEVVRHDETVKAVKTDAGRTLKSRVLIDATEYGDLLPLTGAAFRLGNGTSDEPKPESCVQDFTYVAVIRKYQKTPPELIMRKPPPGYSPARHDVYAQAVQEIGLDLKPGYPAPWSFKAFIKYRGVPDSANPKPYDPKTDNGAGLTRTSMNIMANDVPTSSRLISDPAFRAESLCQAKAKTLQLLYYIQHDLGHTEWSLANDEGYDKAGNVTARLCPLLAGFESIERYFPLEPYVRESRRLIGLDTLTGRDIMRDGDTGQKARLFPDSIAVGYFPIDLHRCKKPEDLEPALDDAGHLSGSAGPFEVPMSTLIPVSVDGLLAAEKNFSVSRIAASSIRLQPIAFAVGQAAGALASLAAKRHVAPREVLAESVRAELLKTHSQVDVPGT